MGRNTLDTKDGQNWQLTRPYTLSEFATITGKSSNLVYRRLTEKPARFTVRYARKEGDRWAFDRRCVDEAVAAGESLIVRKKSSIDQVTALKYFSGRFRSCGKDLK